tara:strand:- start:1561 stop:2040 length:480 start_codon:yes stop_codon:yes gene_type:complete
MILYVYYSFIENSKYMALIKKYFWKNLTCIILIPMLLIIFGIYSLVNAQQLEMRSGPPIYCGHKEIIDTSLRKIKETEFSVLTNMNPAELYFILFRNFNTGSWTIVAHNAPNIPAEHSCIMFSGYTSYILPDIEELQKTLDKQKKGLDKQTDPLLERES